MHCASTFSLCVVPRAAVGASDASRVTLRSGRPLASWSRVYSFSSTSEKTKNVSRRELMTCAALGDDDGMRESADAPAVMAMTGRRVAMGSGVAFVAAAVAATTATVSFPRRADAADAGDWSSPGADNPLFFF